MIFWCFKCQGAALLSFDSFVLSILTRKVFWFWLIEFQRHFSIFFGKCFFLKKNYISPIISIFSRLIFLRLSVWPVNDEIGTIYVLRNFQLVSWTDSQSFMRISWSQMKRSLERIFRIQKNRKQICLLTKFLESVFRILYNN